MLNDFVFNQLHPITPVGSNRSKFHEIVEIPDLTEIAEAFETLKAFIPGLFADMVYWHCYTISDCVVQINKELFEKQKVSFCEVASTPEELKKLAIIEKLFDLLNTVKALSNESNPEVFCINGLTSYDQKKDKY